MYFKELKPEIFEELAKKHPQFTFHQTPGWAKLKASIGWKYYFVGVFEGNDCLGLALLLGKKVPYLDKYIFYSPRGLLVDYGNIDVLSFFSQEIKLFLKKKKGIFLKIDPYVTYKQRDNYGNLVENGFDHSEYVTNLKNAGYKHMGFNIEFNSLQPRFLSVLYTEGKTIEELEAGYVATRRNEIKQCIRNGIYTREMKYEELPIFQKLMEETGKRKHYNTRPLSYYQEMWKDLYEGGYMKVAITFMNFKKGIELNQKALDEILENRRIFEEKVSNGELKVNPKKIEGRKKEEDITINSYRKNIETFTKLQKQYGEETPVSVLLWLMSDNDMISILSGNDENFMKYNPSFSCYNWGIQYAVDHHIGRYNFYGVTGNFSKNNPEYGLFEMKQRFGACIEELIGEFELVVSPFWHKAFKALIKIKNKG